MFGIGFIVGPVLGGVLGDFWVRLPFIAAALLNAGNLLLALFMLPESLYAEPRADQHRLAQPPAAPQMGAIDAGSVCPSS